VLAAHRKQLEAQMADMQANLDELKTHEKEARALLAKALKPAARASA
jgi:septal ring factor EnvC (AmiA/AmiB activator)